MKKFTTIISAILTAAVLLSGCENGNSDIRNESETTTASVTEETQVQTEETSSVTVMETTTETTDEVTTKTSETTEGTGGTTSEGLVISPSGYVLDPQNVIPEDTNFWTEEGSGEIRKSGLAYLLMELSDRETRVYGVYADKEPSKIIIEHDGVGDEFEHIWWTRYGNIAYNDTSSCKLLDIDGDGENEVVTTRYAVGGTFCCIDELSIYKMEDGHYKRYELDHEKLAEEYIKTDIDSASKTVTVSVKGADEDFVYDSPESCPEGVKKVWYRNLVSYDIEGSSVKMSYFGLMGPDETGSALPIDDMIRVDFTVTLKDGEFVLSDPLIKATDYFDGYSD